MTLLKVGGGLQAVEGHQVGGGHHLHTALPALQVLDVEHVDVQVFRQLLLQVFLETFPRSISFTLLDS